MINCIFLGSIYPDDLFNELKTRGQFIDYPANIFQRSLLNGLDIQYPDLQVISSPVIKSRYSSVYDICKKNRFSHNNSVLRADLYVGTCPVKGLQLLIEFCRVYRALKRGLNAYPMNGALIIYALHSPFLLAATLLRKKIGCSCVIVPDLPEYMSGKGSLLRRVGKKIDREIIDFCLRRLDCFVLLSGYMREKLPIKDKPWTLVEGIYDISATPKNVERCKERVIFYGGNLSMRYGIMELLEAFHEIDKDNYRLWICGEGEGREDVIKMSLEDNRIKYFGIVEHDEVLSLQQQATVLVNPRNSSGDYTKYSFPSKTMEYLASGTPTVMCHLPAIPKEYDQYIYYITDESSKGIKNKLIEVCEKPQIELDEFGRKAAKFIREKKNSKKQSQKISDMINRIIMH